MAEDNGVKTPEEVEAQEAALADFSLSFKSKEDSDTGGGDFKALAENIYKMCVQNIELRDGTDFDGNACQFIMVTFAVIEAMDGKDIKDIDGDKQEPGVRLFWEWLSTTALGFKTDGTPSKTRACLSALMGQSPEDELEIDNLSELIGAECKAFLTVTKKKDGTDKNKAIKFSKL